MYIASPYRGDIDHNRARAKEYCRFAVSLGAIPFAPHIYFTQFLDDNIHEERELGLRMGLEMIELCQELWVIGNRISEGMVAEIEAAKRLRRTSNILLRCGKVNLPKNWPKANLSPNARVILKKRYLKKDQYGNPTETPEDMFHRVALVIA